MSWTIGDIVAPGVLKIEDLDEIEKNRNDE